MCNKIVVEDNTWISFFYFYLVIKNNKQWAKNIFNSLIKFHFYTIWLLFKKGKFEINKHISNISNF